MQKSAKIRKNLHIPQKFAKISKMQGKSMIFEVKTQFGKARTRLDKVGRTRPGGTRGGCIFSLRAESDRICAFNTALARKGLAVFKHYAHSAGPNKYQPISKTNRRTSPT